MGDRPILFSGPMVRALVEGRKTQTRRVLPQPGAEMVDVAKGLSRYQIGMRLWVRETWQAWTEFNATQANDLPDEMRSRLNYVADGNVWDARKRPGIHMPRWASRLTLTVTGVEVERLQDISEEDVLSEGIAPIDSEIASYRGAWDGSGGTLSSEEKRTRRPAFARLWNSIHGPDAWSENSWVAAVSFSVEHRNIDAPHPTASEGADRE